MSKARFPMAGYEGLYEITEDGEVYSLYKGGKKRSVYKDKAGYGRVNLYKDGSSSTHLVHRLVAATFLDTPEEKLLVCHKDGDKSNNHYTNLYYGTHSDNSKDAVTHRTHNLLKENYTGVTLTGEDCNWAKLDEDKVRYIKSMRGKKTCRELSAELGVVYSNISAIWCGRSWRNVA